MDINFDKLEQMQKKIEDVIKDLRAMRKEISELGTGFHNNRLLVNECLLRFALIDAEKAGIRKSPDDS